MPEDNIEKIQKELINLYLETKIRKSDEVSKYFKLNFLFIAQIVNISEETFETERKNLKKISILDLINYIKESLYITIQIKVKEELEKLKNNKDKKILDENVAEDYEALLRKEEAEIRQHICIEHQFKLHSESLEEKIFELKNNNHILEKKIEKMKKKYETQIKDLKNELSFIKIKKNQEKNFKNKLIIKEKEINELKTILNTNASIKSQLSSIYKEPKEEENTKENQKEKDREIMPYMDNNIKKKKHKNKSLSLIERKLNSFNNINRRNLLRINFINKSHNSRNNSKRKNSNNKNKNINSNNNINNLNYNSEYKYKTIANIYSGSSSKRTKNDNSLKIKHKIKNSNYYNYNSINSLRHKKFDKSVSRSMPSKRGVEESFNKNYFLNINRSDIDSNKNRKIIKENNVIKNKILINYNTNIINTNISIDKVSINKKMKELKNSLEDKMSDNTRNKKNSIRRTISAFYDKKDKSSIFQEKIKTKRENSFKHKNIYNLDKNINNNSKIRKNKNNYDRFNNINNGYNSNVFRKKFPQLTIQQKNKNIKKVKKMNIKLKDNSMFNIKNDISKDFNKNKFLIIQAYTGKNENDDVKLSIIDEKNNKIKKNASNKNIISIKKNQNFCTNNKILKSNPYNADLTHRKYKNFDRISILYDKKLNKNENKLKINKFKINNSNTSRINSSLRNFIFSKCISSSNIS